MLLLVSYLVLVLPVGLLLRNNVHTLEELKERMAETLDEITILEVLEIKSENLVEVFEDRINDRFDQLCDDLFEEEEDE